MRVTPVVAGELTFRERDLVAVVLGREVDRLHRTGQHDRADELWDARKKIKRGNPTPWKVRNATA